MASISQLYSSFVIFALIFHSCLHHKVVGDHQTRREGLEIIIGGGGVGPVPSPGYQDCPPPPPEPICPPPPPPPELICPPPPPPPIPPRPPSPRPRPPPLSPSPRPPKPRPSPPPPPTPKPTPTPTPSQPNELLERARKVIQQFRTRINCDPQNILKSWNGNDVCNYKGFACEMRPDVKKRAVAGVDFNGYNFGGPALNLSGFLEELDDLAIFHVNSNNFARSIPKLTSKIKYLYELDVSNNNLSGSFPMEVLNCRRLTFLDLRFNSFTGKVPPEVFNLDLDVLFINNNKFSENLPSNIGSTKALYLTFANNKFTGPIPSSIGNAKYLLEVLFLNNKFSGCLPYEIGLLRNATLFDVGTNMLTGRIPHSFGCLASMENLNLADNQFYGPVPEMVCKLPKLANLSLSSNYFTQIGPECRKLLMRNKLDVRMNCILDLPYQRSPEECRKFFSKPRICPNEKLLNLVPCMKNGYSNQTDTETFDQKSTVELAPAPSPRTYAALKPDRL